MCCHNVYNKSGPIPFNLCSHHQSIIPLNVVSSLSLQLQLDSKSIYSYDQLIPSELFQYTKLPSLAPFWVRAGTADWNYNIHCIYYYYHELTEEQRSIENAKGHKITNKQRQIYNENIIHLHKYRLHPMVGTSTIGIDVIDGVPCDTCGFIITKPIKEHEKYMKIRKLYPYAKCIQCEVVGVNQKIKALLRNRFLNTIYLQQIMYPKPLEPHRTSIITINVKTFLTNELDKNAIDDIMPLFGDLSSDSMTIKVIQIPEYIGADEYSYFIKKIEGAECNINSFSNHPCIIGHDKIYDATMIIFPRRKGKEECDRNFTITFNAGYDRNDIVEYIRSEEVIIRQNNLSKRIGPATGIIQLGDISTGLSKITQQQTTFHYSSEDSCSFSALYYNNGKLIDMTGWGYKNQHGERVSSTNKTKQGHDNEHFRNMLRRESLAVLKAMACLQACQIPPKKGKKYLNELKDLMERKKGMHISDILIEYMYGFEEFRNYSPVCAHCDANRTAEYEILMIFDRLGCNTKVAYLYFPLDNVILEITVNEDINVTNFTNTVHVADPSRGGNAGSGGSGGNSSRASWSKT